MNEYTNLLSSNLENFLVVSFQFQVHFYVQKLCKYHLYIKYLQVSSKTMQVSSVCKAETRVVLELILGECHILGLMGWKN